MNEKRAVEYADKLQGLYLNKLKQSHTSLAPHRDLIKEYYTAQGPSVADVELTFTIKDLPRNP